MTSSGPERRHAIAGLAMVLVLLALVGVNVRVMIRNQAEAPCAYAVCLKPKAIEPLAAANRHPAVHGRYSTYHMLHRIAGATVTMPAWMAEQPWHLARVARVRVVVAPDRVTLAPDKVRGLRDAAVASTRWLWGSAKKRRRHYRPVHLIVEPGATDYVVAETTEEVGEVFVVPTSTLRGAAAAP